MTPRMKQIIETALEIQSITGDNFRPCIIAAMNRLKEHGISITDVEDSAQHDPRVKWSQLSLFNGARYEPKAGAK